MTDSATTETQPKDDALSGAPWTREDFDAERAWRLVEKLRGDLSDAKTERDTLRSERQEREDAEKTETERLSGRLTDAEQKLADAQRAVYVERALRKHSIPEDLVEFLTGSTEEEITAKAERLAALGSGRKPEEDAAKGTQPDPSGKPKPALTPGHGGEEEPTFDPAAIAKSARRR